MLRLAAQASCRFRPVTSTLGRKMTRWTLPETYSLVQARFGATQEFLARPSIRSVEDRRLFASYHFTEALRLHNAFERNYMQDKGTILDMHRQGAEKTRLAFERLMIKAGAHSLAAVQSLHAIPDTLAHAVYYAAGLNLEAYALAESDISLPKVVGLLRRSTTFSTLSAPLSKVQSGSAWKHLAAVSNMSKHRSVVRSTLSEDWTGSRKNFRELFVSQFERHGVTYQTKSLRDLLEPEYDRLSSAIVEIGNKLNACLRSVAA